MMFAVFVCGCTAAQKTNSLPQEMQPNQIKSVMTKVADWQLANPSKHTTTAWTHGALFAGMTAWAQMADSDTYYNALRRFGEKNGWRPHKRIYHADDHVVAQMYLEMYKKYKDPKMIAPIRNQFDHILANQPRTPVLLKNQSEAKLNCSRPHCFDFFEGFPFGFRNKSPHEDDQHHTHRAVDKEWESAMELLN